MTTRGAAIQWPDGVGDGSAGPGPRPVLVWFRRDLRLSDNPALRWAAGTGRPVIPVFVLDEETADCALGGASRWWLHGSLRALAAALGARGSRLVLRRGPAKDVIPEFLRETGCQAIAWNRLYEPRAVARDRCVKARSEGLGVEVRSFNASLLFEPWDIATTGGSPYRVFTPFWRRCLDREFGAPGGPPPRLAPPRRWPAGEDLGDWDLRSRTPDWAAGLRRTWRPGEDGARARLDAFTRAALDRYRSGRERPGEPGTSMLSPHLRFGEIGPRQIVGAVDAIGPGPGCDAFLRELGWREFAHHLLFHNPGMEEANMRPAFDRVAWRDDPRDLERWQRGRTGVPLVDAGMRELWATGWMHNRVRMVAASFLVKHLLIDWRAGAAWFLDTLVDADRANNSAGWQWVAGSGVDAAPYFRIFNPVAQSRRFDGEGSYLRRWLPELRLLPDAFVHAPWTAPGPVLEAARVSLGSNWPMPVVDLDAGRDRALAALRDANRVRPGGPQG